MICDIIFGLDINMLREIRKARCRNVRYFVSLTGSRAYKYVCIITEGGREEGSERTRKDEGERKGEGRERRKKVGQVDSLSSLSSHFHNCSLK